MAGWQRNRTQDGNTGGSKWGGNQSKSTGNAQGYKKPENGTTPQNRPQVSNDEAKQAWAEAEIGALWQKEGKDGAFFTGTVNGVDIIILKNKNKKEGKHPDYRIYIKEKFDAITGFVKKSGAPAAQNKPSYQAPKQTPQPQEKPEFDDEIDENMEDLVF